MVSQNEVGSPVRRGTCPGGQYASSFGVGRLATGCRGRDDGLALSFVRLHNFLTVPDNIYWSVEASAIFLGPPMLSFVG